MHNNTHFIFILCFYFWQMEELHLLVQEEGRAVKHAAFSVPVEPLLSLQPDSEQASSVSPNLFAGKSADFFFIP
jgi:hypothetical protein